MNVTFIPWNPNAKPGDADYRPGPDYPPSLGELRALRSLASQQRIRAGVNGRPGNSEPRAGA